MKGIVAYDSVNGNTKLVAEAIAEEIGKAGHQVETYYLKEGVPAAVSGDFLFVGSPTRGGKPTKRTMEFLDGLGSSWSGKPAVAFDTVGPLSKDAEKRREWLQRIDQGGKNAASRIAEACRGHGLKVAEPLHIAVVGMWGPLAPDALDMARERTRSYLERLR